MVPTVDPKIPGAAPEPIPNDGPSRHIPNRHIPSSLETEPMLYCPVCSRRLAERKCKLFCEQCGYYMSCADYY